MLHSMPPFNDSFIWGFDSFKGLPLPENNDANKTLWKPGGFAADPRLELLHEWGEHAVGFVAGFFNESLAEGAKLSHRLSMMPAKYIDIDVDLYSSSLEVLRFLFRTGLVVPGTVIGYDDFSSFLCTPTAERVSSPLLAGEGLAHAQTAEEFGVRYICLAGSCLPPHAGQSCQAFGAIFLVESIGHPNGGKHGYNLTPQAVSEWQESDPCCRSKVPSNVTFTASYRNLKVQEYWQGRDTHSVAIPG